MSSLAVVKYDSPLRLSGEQVGGEDFAQFAASWNQHPVIVDHQSILNYPRVLEIISGRSKAPSQHAQLQEGELCDTVRLLDKKYRAATLKYKNAMTIATVSDKATIVTLQKTNTFRDIVWESVFKPNQCSQAGGVGLAAAGGCKVKGWAAGPLAIFAGCLLVAGVYYKRKEKNDEIDKKGSAERLRVLHEIDVLENQRLKNVKKTIVKACNRLVDQARDLQQINEMELITAEQSQLSTVYKAIFKQYLKVDQLLNTASGEITPEDE